MAEDSAGIAGDVVESLITLLWDINDYCRDIGNLHEEYAAILMPISLAIAEHAQAVNDHVRAILELRNAPN